MRRSSFALLLLAAGCPEGQISPPPGQNAPVSIGEDLVLEARILGPSTFEPGQSIPLQLAVRNRSAARKHRVVKPGDGSESGWREPHVFFTAEAEKRPGAWEPVPRIGLPRCGVFDPNWEKDVVELGPGEGLPLGDWVPSPHHFFHFQDGGRVRLRVHYAYQGGIASRGGPKPGKTPESMRGVPAYELVSDPVEFELR